MTSLLTTLFEALLFTATLVVLLFIAIALGA